MLACANSEFPESGFLSNVASGNLITNASSGLSVNEYATFDFDCAVNAWLVNYGGQDAIQFQNGITSGTTDVEEDTTAFYVQAEFDSMWGDTPFEATLEFGMLIPRSPQWVIAVPSQLRKLMALDLSLPRETRVSRLETDTQSDYQSGYRANCGC